MLSKFRPRSAYDVMAAGALFIALGGSAYAATQLPQNSVGTAQLKNGAVTFPKIAAGAKARRIWMDTNAGIKPGTVFETSDFKLTTYCDGYAGGVGLRAKAPANVAVSGMSMEHDEGGQQSSGPFSDFVKGGHDFGVAATSLGAIDRDAVTLTIQSYPPGKDTARNYTLDVVLARATINGANKCFAYGTITPATRG